jgi:hypothetical protein
MEEITPRSTGSIVATLLAVVLVLVLAGAAIKLLAWTISGLIPLLLATALVLIIIRLWQGKRIF